jgi:hypothetical protein
MSLFRRVAGVSIGLSMVACSVARAQGPGVSHELAISRAARLSDLHYSISFDVKPHAPTIAGQETLTFADSGSGDLALDFRDGTLAEATLNGKTLEVSLPDGHLNPARHCAAQREE